MLACSRSLQVPALPISNSDLTQAVAVTQPYISASTLVDTFSGETRASIFSLRGTRPHHASKHAIQRPLAGCTFTAHFLFACDSIELSWSVSEAHGPSMSQIDHKCLVWYRYQSDAADISVVSCPISIYSSMPLPRWDEAIEPGFQHSTSLRAYLHLHQGAAALCCSPFVYSPRLLSNLRTHSIPQKPRKYAALRRRASRTSGPGCRLVVAALPLDRVCARAAGSRARCRFLHERCSFARAGTPLRSTSRSRVDCI